MPEQIKHELADCIPSLGRFPPVKFGWSRERPKTKVSFRAVDSRT
jgi:hypothetical protein